LQLAEALGTATGTAVGGTLLGLLGQLGRSPEEAHASVFGLMLVATLLGRALASRLSS
jgi:hypothetical protein